MRGICVKSSLEDVRFKMSFKCRKKWVTSAFVKGIPHFLSNRRNAIFVHVAGHYYTHLSAGSPSCGMQYILMLFTTNLTTLACRREDMSRKFFSQITEPTSCLHQLLSDPRQHAVISRLRTYQKFPRVFARTKRYCSFILYALNHYQDGIAN